MKHIFLFAALAATACASPSRMALEAQQSFAPVEAEAEPACQTLEVWNGTCLGRAAENVTEAEFARAEAMLDEICGPYASEEACSDAIDRMLSPSDTLFNPSRAVTYLDRKCRGYRAQIETCLRVATLQQKGVEASQKIRFEAPSDWQGWGIAATPTNAVGSIVRACNLGDQTACRQAAMEYASGRYVGRNPQRAFQLYRQLCYEGDASSCEEAYKLQVFE